MVRIAIALIAVAVFAGKPSGAQECVGDPTDPEGFECDTVDAGALTTGSVFTPSTALAPSPRVARAIEEVLEEESEEEGTGGGASPDDGARFGIFLNGLASVKDIDEERELGSDSTSFGVGIGTDYRSERFVVGATIDYSHEDTDFDDDAGETDTDEFGIQLIGIAYPVGDLYVAASARFAYDEYDTERVTPVGVAKGDPEGHKISVAGGAGYDFDLGRGVLVGLSGLLRYESTHIDSYRESGAAAQPASGVAANLEYDDDEIDTLTSFLELNGQKSFNVPWGVVIPELVFRYLHEFLNDSRTIEAEALELSAVAGDETLIRFRTNRPDRNYFNLGAAVTTVFPAGLALFVDYHAEVGHRFREEHVVNFGVRTSFASLFRLVGGAPEGGS